jgi:hypothetical protein
MRSASLITIAGAAVAAAGTLNGASVVSIGASQHVDTVLAYSPRHDAAARTSMAAADPIAARNCVDAGTCDESPSAKLESSTHCICYSDADAITARSGSSNDTSSGPPRELTGGAIPQQMQASMAGLLGFFIMSLVML